MSLEGCKLNLTEDIEKHPFQASHAILTHPLASRHPTNLRSTRSNTTRQTSMAFQHPAITPKEKIPDSDK
jgi:hypothetical protein